MQNVLKQNKVKLFFLIFFPNFLLFSTTNYAEIGQLYLYSL